VLKGEGGGEKSLIEEACFFCNRRGAGERRKEGIKSNKIQGGAGGGEGGKRKAVTVVAKHLIELGGAQKPPYSPKNKGGYSGSAKLKKKGRDGTGCLLSSWGNLEPGKKGPVLGQRGRSCSAKLKKNRETRGGYREFEKERRSRLKRPKKVHRENLGLLRGWCGFLGGEETISSQFPQGRQAADAARAEKHVSPKGVTFFKNWSKRTRSSKANTIGKRGLSTKNPDVAINRKG